MKASATWDRVLPVETLDAVKHHVLDTFAAMVSGSELPPGKAALSFAAAQGGKPVATVAGSTILLSPMDAALINGVLATRTKQTTHTAIHSRIPDRRPFRPRSPPASRCRSRARISFAPWRSAMTSALA